MCVKIVRKKGNEKSQRKGNKIKGRAWENFNFLIIREQRKEDWRNDGIL